MTEKDNFVIAFALGVFVWSVTTMGIWHLQERECQIDNNVADCEWILIPTKGTLNGKS